MLLTLADNLRMSKLNIRKEELEMKVNGEWLEKAIEAIQNNLANKLELDNVIIYKCGTIIRIDIKY